MAAHIAIFEVLVALGSIRNSFFFVVAVGILTNVKRVYKIKKMGKLFNQCLCARYLDYISSTVTTLKGLSYRSGLQIQHSYNVSICFTGWDEGVIGMQIGEVARLRCSPDYAYGAGGFPAWGIQPNSVLDFEIEVLSVQ